MIPDSWLELWDVLSRNPLRSLLTASGVFWGMLMLVIMLGFGAGLERGVSSTMNGYATNAVFLWGRARSMPYKGFATGSSTRPTLKTVPALRQAKGLDVLAPRNQYGGWRGGTNVRFEGELGNFSVMGDVPDFRAIQPMNFRFGRWMNEGDLNEHRKVAVIGEEVRKQLFGKTGDPVGQWIFIAGSGFQVIGSFASTRAGDSGEREETAIHIPLSSFQDSYPAYKNQVTWFAATAIPSVPADVLEAEMHRILREQMIVHPDDDRAFGSWNTHERFGKIRQLFDAIRFLVWFVGLATLLSGIIGVSNISLITVRERTSEIGVRRALGATPWQIVFMILQEAFLLTAVAGYSGLICGVVLLELASYFIGEGTSSMGPPDVDITVALTAMVVVIIGGVLAGVLPARRAALIHPVEALRS